MVSIAKYNQTTTLMEDFYYLGADVTYASDEDFKNVLATCELHLETNPNTSVIDTKEFVATYSRGQDTVAFRNTLSGELTVNKIWLNADGYSDPDSHSSLTLQIWYRTVDRAGNKSEWKIYEATSIVLSQGNWSATVTGLPMSDEMGNTYEYCVKEPDEYLYTYQVTYQYGSIVSNANEQAMLEGQVQGRDTGYAMSIQQGNSYGSVTITNKTTYANELPHTGGSGTMPYAATGVGLIILAGLGMFLFGRNKRSTVG
jgi:LPXTG-motif cell wall-anchored protein